MFDRSLTMTKKAANGVRKGLERKNPTILWFSFYMMMTIMTYRQRKANNKNENVNETIQKFDWVRGEMPQRQKGRKIRRSIEFVWLYFGFIQVFVILENVNRRVVLPSWTDMNGVVVGYIENKKTLDTIYCRADYFVFYWANLQLRSAAH